MSNPWQIFKLGQFIWNFKKFIAQHKLSKQFCANTLCWSLSILYGTYQVTFPAYQDRALELPPKAPNFGLETLDFSHRLKDRVNWVTQLKKGLHAITARRQFAALASTSSSKTIHLSEIIFFSSRSDFFAPNLHQLNSSTLRKPSRKIPPPSVSRCPWSFLIDPQ